MGIHPVSSVIFEISVTNSMGPVTTLFSEIASVIESSNNAENNIYDIVDHMLEIMDEDQLNQVEDFIVNHYPID